jgi:hypothetical protein
MSAKKVLLIAGITVVVFIALVGSCVAALSGPRSGASGTGVGSAVPGAVAGAQAGSKRPSLAFPGQMDGDLSTDVGGAISVDGVVISAAALREVNTSIGNYLCSQVVYQNNSSESMNFNGGFDWKLQDPNGVGRMTGFGGSKNSLSAGELAPGGNLSGDVCWDGEQVLKGQYVILLDPSFDFSDDRYAWLGGVQ